MSGPWTKHWQSAWEERSINYNLPDWVRVVAVAYGGHSANGHCPLSQGALAVALAKPNKHGELVPRPRQRVNEAINRAVLFGFLAEGSGSLCLRVPPHAITGGWGNPLAKCRVCDA